MPFFFAHFDLNCFYQTNYHETDQNPARNNSIIPFDHSTRTHKTNQSTGPKAGILI
jgi:hypothetical protein